jgi:hypothetical protein
MTARLYRYPERDTFGPEPGNAVSRAAGHLGMAIRSGDEAEIAKARADLDCARLARMIRKTVPALTPRHRRELVAAIKTAGE